VSAPDEPSELAHLSALPPPAPPALSSLLEAELAELAPIATRRPVRQLALLITISLLFGAGVLAMLAMRHDARTLPMGWLLGVAIAWLLGFVAPMYLAIIPRRGAVMPRWHLAGLAAVLGAIAFIALGLALPAPVDLRAALHTGSHAGADWEHFWRGSGCLGIGLTAAVVPILLGAIVLRRTLPVGSRGIAAALGAGAGSFGGLLLHLHCPITNTLHVGLLHGGAVGIAALLAAALVPRVIDVR
jgi:Negative regulator of sigma F